MVRAVSKLDAPTRRAREVNWGDRTRLAGRETKTLAWVSIEEARSMTVYGTAFVRGAGSSGVACVASIEWGHGGASIAEDYSIVQRLRVPLVASMVKISGRLLNRGGGPPPATVVADVSLFIAPGSDGETLRNTEWTHDAGAEGELAAGPARLMSVEGYNAGAADTWVMLFDGPAVNGAVPTIARPLRAGRPFAVRRFDSHAFRASIAWSASSTPLTLTKDPSARLRVDAELLR
ncbi:MAG: hypothetical protein ACRELY_25370 [Polyangiaceae bacterium]